MDTAAVSAVQQYAASRSATQPGDGDGGSVFGTLANDFASTLAESEQVAQ